MSVQSVINCADVRANIDVHLWSAVEAIEIGAESRFLCLRCGCQQMYSHASER